MKLSYSAMLLFLIVNAGLSALGVHEPPFADWDFDIRNQFGTYSNRVALRGDIELSEDDTAIVAMGERAKLYMKQSRAFQVVEFLAEKNKTGGASYSLWVNGVKRNIGESEKMLIADLLRLAAGDYGVGGGAKMDRLYNEKGIDPAVEVLRKVRSSSVLAYLIESFSGKHTLAADEALVLIGAAGGIGSSSTLREVLELLAKRMSDDDSVTAALIETAGNISSSSDTRDCLISIGQERGLNGKTAGVMAAAARHISSSDDKRRVLEYLSGELKSDPAAVDEFLKTAATISSSSDKRYSLIALIENPFPVSAYERFFRVVKGISSSDDKTRVLEETAERIELNSTGIEYYLEACASISSSSDKAQALTALENQKLSVENYASLFQIAGSISSSSDQRRVLTEIAGWEGFGSHHLGGYMSAVDSISSSDDAARAVIALDNISIEGDDNFETLFLSIESISSSEDQRRTLVHTLKTQDISPEGLRHYLEAAITISSSDDKAGSILELISYAGNKGREYTGNAGLKDAVRDALETISSRDEREKCYRAVLDTFH